MIKKVKWIVLAVLVVAAIAIAGGVKFTSVSEYQNEAKTLAGSCLVDEKKTASHASIEREKSEKASKKINSERVKKSKESVEKTTKDKKKAKKDKEKKAGSTKKRKKNSTANNKGSTSEKKTKASSKDSFNKAVNDENSSPKKSDTDIGEQDKAKENTGDQKKIECTMTIDCKSLLDSEKLTSDEKKLTGENGYLAKDVKLSVETGSSAFDLLKIFCKAKQIPLSYKYTPMYASYYVKGINNFFEAQFGNKSGWVYLVNDNSIKVGSSKYKLMDGDFVYWKYTIDGLK